MKRIVLTGVLLLFIASVSTAEQVIIRHVRELTDSADVIARVTIICVINTGSKEGYSKIAYARVTDAIRGIEQGVVFELENYVADIACPNVRYNEGEDVLLFAKRMPNGHYETLYADAGKFLIEKEAVSKQPFRVGQTYRTARAEIKRELLKQRRGSALANAASAKQSQW
jgi:hypothetical protein